MVQSGRRRIGPLSEAGYESCGEGPYRNSVHQK